MLPPPWRIKKKDSEGFYWKYFFLIKIKPSLSERYFKQNTQSRAWNSVSVPRINLGNMGWMRKRRVNCLCVCVQVCVIASFCCLKHTCTAVSVLKVTTGECKEQQTCVILLLSYLQVRPSLFCLHVLLRSSWREMKLGTQSGVGRNQSTPAENGGWF